MFVLLLLLLLKYFHQDEPFMIKLTKTICTEVVNSAISDSMVKLNGTGNIFVAIPQQFCP